MPLTNPDYYYISSLLCEEERMVRQTVRDFVDTEIIPIIEWIGARRKIFNIHLRNIKGGWNNFQEVYPDNGEMDFVQVMRTLREVGYDGMVMPDHVPQHEAPGASAQAFAFSYGYIKALLQTVYGYHAVSPTA